ncbi:hypothetical protein KCU93_g23, partial [Aureobasidium melanogenum]
MLPKGIHSTPSRTYRKVKLFEPQSLYFVGTDEAVLRKGKILTHRACSSRHRLQRGPFVIRVSLILLSAIYTFGISTILLGRILVIGFIQVSASFLLSVSIHS